VKKAIVIACNGTTDLNLKEKTLDRLFVNVRDKFLNYDVLMAFTSKKVINKLKNRMFLVIPWMMFYQN